MPSHRLSYGALELISQGININQPVFQILDHTCNYVNYDLCFFRFKMSDGKYAHNCFALDTDLNYMRFEGTITTNSVVRIDKYKYSTGKCKYDQCKEQEHRVIKILGLTVLTYPDHRIGNPLKLHKYDCDHFIHYFDIQ